MAKAVRKSVAIKNKSIKKLSKKEDIIKAAARLFSEKSFHDVKMDEIAEELGIAKGTIYLYFKSKEKLYLEILEESYEAIEALLEKEIAIDEPSTLKLKRVLGIIFGFYRRNLDVLKILSRDETHLIKEHFEFTEHWRLRRLKLYEKILEKGIKEGSFSVQNPKLTSLIIFGLVRSVMFFYSTQKNTSDIAEEVFNVITNGILNSKVSDYEKNF
ncbi:MAG: TetR/AcrR family transcriptional regulator [Candidatus Dadabacteria bacterium]|nr:TetR/AcrR family transcriptional regulator [Candidatus Dadabacteria bacterium]NIS10079.1 TetR/AcrR family transcriptional regulator [Candidatus Dadabacteria bacterium]NIV42156.1 TetR family transcriptional regulator [Candidatus Dadabacteria bacterium]NIX16465.1 TetR family transcriptional regulator [Candidatus Dadabacteria bacterium]NIY23026.1 TetR family transcriptional regulator [Candidatus Dadabacteria bacterium]